MHASVQVHHERFKDRFGREPASTGLAGSLLLLFWGDVEAARDDWRHCAACWAKIHDLIEMQRGTHAMCAARRRPLRPRCRPLPRI